MDLTDVALISKACRVKGCIYNKWELPDDAHTACGDIYIQPNVDMGKEGIFTYYWIAIHNEGWMVLNRIREDRDP